VTDAQENAAAIQEVTAQVQQLAGSGGTGGAETPPFSSLALDAVCFNTPPLEC
jgi:hypothetical protein